MQSRIYDIVAKDASRHNQRPQTNNLIEIDSLSDNKHIFFFVELMLLGAKSNCWGKKTLKCRSITLSAIHRAYG